VFAKLRIQFSIVEMTRFPRNSVLFAGAAILAGLATVHAKDQEAGKPARQSFPPAQLKAEELAGIDELAPLRRKLIEFGLQSGRNLHIDKYVFGSADPKNGGFDCSGATRYMMKSVGLEPPRSSAAQYDWVKKAGTLVDVPPGTTSLDDKVFGRLRPGDLLFWAGTYHPTDGRANGITHVQIYLGREKKDGRMVMIGSSDGRSYRGRRQCGFGVFDFRLPRPGSKSRFVGFASPPGLEAGKKSTSDKASAPSPATKGR
jgi:hypothetical protein